MGSSLPALGIPSKADLYAAALEGLVRVNELLMTKSPLPSVYDAGARWLKVPHTTWRRADQIAAEKWADCEGLSAYRAAELRHTGEDPNARVGIYHTGPAKYHAIVLRGDDRIEDPSIALGMRGRPGMPQTREEMNMVNGRWPSGPLPPPQVIVGDCGDETPPPGTYGFQVVSHPLGGFCGEVSIPLADGNTMIALSSPALDQAQAAAKGANVLLNTADKIIKNPLLLANLDPTTAAAMAVLTHPLVKKQLVNAGKAGIAAAKQGARAAKKIGGAVKHLKFW